MSLPQKQGCGNQFIALDLPIQFLTACLMAAVAFWVELVVEFDVLFLVKLALRVTFADDVAFTSAILVEFI